MKKLHLICCIILSIGLQGCSDSSGGWWSGDASEKKIERLEAEKTQLKQEISSLKEQLSDQQKKYSAALETLRQENEEIAGQVATLGQLLQQSKAQIKVLEGNVWKLHLWKFVALGVLALIATVFAFIFWPRRLPLPSPTDGTNSLKCPYCGCEHDPGDTVCKNPACKTQF